MTRLRLAILALAVALLGPGRSAAQPTVPDHEWAGRAWKIFRDHCHECHGGPGESQAGLRLLDPARFTGEQRPLVVPGDPDASYLLELVRAGTMPPGNRPKLNATQQKDLSDWITAGAPTYLGDEFVRQVVLADVRNLPSNQRTVSRYLSLNHLLDRPDSKESVQRWRDRLASLTSTRNQNKLELTPVPHAEESVFRIDLSPFGWEQRLRDKSNEQPSPYAWFDLILLEYPWGEVLPADETTAGLVRDYLGPASLLRPFPFLRGDWFFRLTQSEGWGNELEVTSTASTPDADSEAEQPSSRRRLLPTLDSIRTDSSGEKRTLPVRWGALTKGALQTTTTFKVQDYFFVRIQNQGDKDVFVEIHITDDKPKGDKSLLVALKRVKAGETLTVPGDNEALIRLDKPEVSWLTLFASETEFPEGIPLSGPGKVRDRWVHPFLRLDKERGTVEMPTDPGKIEKETIRVEVK